MCVVQGGPCRLTALDDSCAGFAAALRRVDACGPRGVVTAHVFCARSKQDNARDIVANSRTNNLPPGFIHMLRG